MIKDYTSATESHKRALNIRQEVLGKDHKKTGVSYYNLRATQYVLRDKLGATQYVLSDYTSATESLKRTLIIRQKVMRRSLTATISWGLPNICLKVTPQPPSQTSEH